MIKQIKKSLEDPYKRAGHLFCIELLERATEKCFTPFHEEVRKEHFVKFLKTLLKHSKLSDEADGRLLQLILKWEKLFEKKYKNPVFKDLVIKLK